MILQRLVRRRLTLIALLIVIGMMTVACQPPLASAATPVFGSPPATTSTTVTTAPATPVIELFYGDAMNSGALGRPQRALNILGNVSDPDGVTSLTYSLNGAGEVQLGIGPDGARLQRSGDFNVEIPYASLAVGANTVELRGIDGSGMETSRTVIIDHQAPQPLSLPYVANWSTAGAIADRGAAVDGRWTLGPGGVRSSEPGYDRLIVLGDTSWTDYEVTVPVTVHELARQNAAVGVLLRWRGHGPRKAGEQPGREIYPLGAWAWHNFGNGAYEIDGLDRSTSAVEALPLNSTMMMKARVETAPNGARYSYKWWPVGSVEPTQWALTTVDHTRPLKSGSILLVSHHVDVTFGDVTVSPVPTP